MAISEHTESLLAKFDQEAEAVQRRITESWRWRSAGINRQLNRLERRVVRGLTVAANRSVAREDLVRIQSALSQFPRKNNNPISSAEANFCSRSRNFGRLGYNALKDGVMVTYTSEVFLAHVSHRFVFPDGGQPAYHQEDFAVDCQATSQPGINLVGTEALLDSPNAVEQICFVAPQIVLDAAQGWESLQPLTSRFVTF